MSFDHHPSWREHAAYLIRNFGADAARRLTEEGRDRNHPATFSYSFHNAVLKFIEEQLPTTK